MTQFIDPGRDLLTRFFVMAATFVMIEVITEFLIASVAHCIRGWLVRSEHRFNQICGGLFVAFGVSLPFSR